MSEVSFDIIEGWRSILINYNLMTAEAGWQEHRLTMLFSTLATRSKSSMINASKTTSSHDWSVCRGSCVLQNGLTIFFSRTSWPDRAEPLSVTWRGPGPASPPLAQSMPWASESPVWEVWLDLVGNGDLSPTQVVKLIARKPRTLV